MLVKKSLWAALAAFVVIGLLFIGCPTESEGSSGEVLDYTKTELWAAVIKAETLLTQTEVSIRPEPPATPTGNDIPLGMKYVTGVQKTAFVQAIEKAKTLAQAGINGVDETEAIEDLAGARTIFETAKETNKASLLTSPTALPGGSAMPADAATVPLSSDVLTPTAPATAVVVIKSGTLPATVKLASGKDLIIPAGIAVTAGTTFDPAGGELLVKSGGTFTISDTGTYTTTNNGIITIESGATYIDWSTPYAFTGSSGDTASMVLKAGGVVKLTGPHFPGGILDVAIGTASGNNVGKILQLTAGKLTVTHAAYVLDGGTTATLVGNLLGSITIKPDATLTVADGTTLITWTRTTVSACVIKGDTPTGGEAPSRIILGTGSKIVVLGGKDAGTPDRIADAPSSGESAGFPTGAAIWDVVTIPVDGLVLPPYPAATTSGVTNAIEATGPAVFEWDATNSEWVKQ